MSRSSQEDLFASYGSPEQSPAKGKLHPQARRHVLTPDSECLVLVMVGLPARGKSFIAKKLERFLRWRGNPAKIFNVGDRRRTVGGVQNAQFFSEANVEQRNKIAEGVLQEMAAWLREGQDEPCLSNEAAIGRAAIFDATNSSRDRRANVVQMLGELMPQCKILFVESVCDDSTTIEINLLQKVRASPDFRGQDEAKALLELRARIREYEAQYETLSPSEGIGASPDRHPPLPAPTPSERAASHRAPHSPPTAAAAFSGVVSTTIAVTSALTNQLCVWFSRVVRRAMLYAVRFMTRGEQAQNRVVAP